MEISIFQIFLASVSLLWNLNLIRDRALAGHQRVNRGKLMRYNKNGIRYEVERVR
jgi:hypothetical protein